MKKKLPAILLFFITFYILFWYAIATLLSNTIGKFANKSFIDQANIVHSFSEVKIKGFPFLPRVWLIGVKQQINDITIAYDAPIGLAYNPLSKVLAAAYKGDISAKLATESKPAGGRIYHEGEYSFFVPYGSKQFRGLITGDYSLIWPMFERTDIKLTDIVFTDSLGKTVFNLDKIRLNLNIPHIEQLARGQGIKALPISCSAAVEVIGKQSDAKEDISRILNIIDRKFPVTLPDVLLDIDFKLEKPSNDIEYILDLKFRAQDPAFTINGENYLVCKQHDNQLKIKAEVNNEAIWQVDGLAGLVDRNIVLSPKFKFITHKLRQENQRNHTQNYKLKLDAEAITRADEDTGQEVGELTIRDSSIIIKDSAFNLDSTHQLDYLQLNTISNNIFQSTEFEVQQLKGTSYFNNPAKLLDIVADSKIFDPLPNIGLSNAAIKELYSDLVSQTTDNNSEELISIDYEIDNDFIKIGKIKEVRQNFASAAIDVYNQLLCMQVAKVAAESSDFVAKFKELAPQLYDKCPDLVQELKRQLQP